MSKFQDLSTLIQQIGQAEEADQVATLNESIEAGLEPGAVALILEAFERERESERGSVINFKII